MARQVHRKRLPMAPVHLRPRHQGYQARVHCTGSRNLGTSRAALAVTACAAGLRFLRSPAPPKAGRGAPVAAKRALRRACGLPSSAAAPPPADGAAGAAAAQP